MRTTINEEKLKKIVKEAIKEVLEEERIDTLLKFIPPVSKKEMEDIIKIYGKPAEKKEAAYSEEMEV